MGRAHQEQLQYKVLKNRTASARVAAAEEWRGQDIHPVATRRPQTKWTHLETAASGATTSEAIAVRAFSAERPRTRGP